jgi:hypothetical protein
MSTPISDAEAAVISAIKEEGRRARLSLALASEIGDFGDNPPTLRYLDQFVDTFRASNAVDTENVTGYTQMLACLIGDMLIDKYGGRWRAIRQYYLELNTPSGATHLAYPFAVVEARITQPGALSLCDYFFQRLPSELALAARPAEPEHPLMKTIRKHSSFVTQYIGHKFGLADFGLNAHSIPQLDLFIDQNTGGLSPEAAKEKYVGLLGAFLGESIASVYHGAWQFDAEGRASLAIAGAGGALTLIDPYSAVARRIENGAADSLAVYFQHGIPRTLAAS